MSTPISDRLLSMPIIDQQNKYSVGKKNGRSKQSIWLTIVFAIIAIWLLDWPSLEQVEATLWPKARICFNSMSNSFQSECVYCDARLYASTISACTGQPVLANNITQAQAFCIATACLQVRVYKELSKLEQQQQRRQQQQINTNNNSNQIKAVTMMDAGGGSGSGGTGLLGRTVNKFHDFIKLSLWRRRSPLMFGHRFAGRSGNFNNFHKNPASDHGSYPLLFAQHRFKRRAYSDRSASTSIEARSQSLGPIDLDDLMHDLSLSMKVGSNASTSSSSSNSSKSREQPTPSVAIKNSIETEARQRQQQQQQQLLQANQLQVTNASGSGISRQAIANSSSFALPHASSVDQEWVKQLLVGKQQAQPYQQQFVKHRQYLTKESLPNHYQERNYLPGPGHDQSVYKSNFGSNIMPFNQGLELHPVRTNSIKDRLASMIRATSSRLEHRRQYKLANLWYWWHLKHSQFGL